MKTFRVVYERDESGAWIVTTPDVQGCHTHGRTIEQARERFREALALFVPDRTAAAAKFDEHVKLPSKVEADVQTVKQLRARLEQTRAELSKVELRVVMCLRQQVHLGHRDAGEILGVSHQRVHQLEKAAAG